MMAHTPRERKQLLVRRIVESRRNDESVVFESGGHTVTYDDRTLEAEFDTGQRGRLDKLLDTYHVFKIKQPETRKAVENVVFLSVVTDAKHAADFIESLFRTVYREDERYELQAVA